MPNAAPVGKQLRRLFYLPFGLINGNKMGSGRIKETSVQLPGSVFGMEKKRLYTRFIPVKRQPGTKV